MKLQYGQLKAIIAKKIYRGMYKSNFSLISDTMVVISNNTNIANKRALEISVECKNRDIRAGKFCVVTLEPPASNKDNQLNKKALKLAHKKKLTKP